MVLRIQLLYNLPLIVKDTSLLVSSGSSFNLFLVAVTLAGRNGLPTNAGIPYTYRLDGSLFNLRRLKAETKISNDKIYELQYADDAAVPAHSAADLQISLDTLSTAYRRAGLLVNTKKTEVLSSVVSQICLLSPSQSMAIPFQMYRSSHTW